MVQTEILFIDMDGLKKINDTYGHNAGDEALKTLALMIQKVCPKNHIAVRYGGDEFLIIGPAQKAGDEGKLNKQLQKEMELYNQSAGNEYAVEASIGYILSNCESDKQMNEYIQEADTLMYHNKMLRKKERKN